MVEEPVSWIQRVQDQIDGQRVAEQLEALIDLFGELFFDISLQLTAQAIVVAL